jgi:hypothetical protein
MAWKAPTHIMIGTKRHDFTDLERNQMAQIHFLTSDLAAAKAATKSALSDRDNFLEEIKAFHLEYGKEDCTTCDGKGEVEVSVTCDYPSARDPMVPAERMELDTCEDCLGTGKEWGI